jgi:hypothetical protein
MSSQSPCLGLCRTLYIIAYAAERHSCVGVVARLDGFAMILLIAPARRMHPSCSQALHAAF